MVQPKFKHNGQTFTNCLLLHRLLVTGGEEELQRTKQKLSSSILSHTCQYEEGSDTHTKVSIIFFPPLHYPHPGDRLAPGCQVQLRLDSKSNP